MVRYIGNFIKVIIFALITSTAWAWEPTKSINVLIGFAPGSGNELSFKGVSSILEKTNPKLSFVVENRPGASGVVAMNDFISRPADGHHIYIPSNQGIFVTAEFFQKNVVKYKLDDFEYVVGIAKSPLVVIAHASSDVNNPAELVNKLKTTTKPINIAAGSGAHKLAYDYMADKIKLDKKMIATVEYKGPAQAGADVAGGHLEFGIIPAAVAAPLAQSGKVKVIGLASERTIKGFENTPLMNKWVPGMNVYAGWGIILPKGTSLEIQKWYVDNFSKAIRSPEAQLFFENNYMFADDRELTPGGFKKSMADLRNLWVPVLKNLSTETDK
jgi:tripartite-type tricarboxylate transporter receptor subunit TctC